jgi:hypothetical protein
VYARLVPDLVREAERNGARPRDILELCRYFTQNPDGLNLNGGALKVAVEHWRPRLEYNAPGLWPQEKLPPITVAASVYSGVGYEDEQKRDQQTGIVRTMTKQGFSREDINKRLMQLGLPTVVTKAEIAAHPLRFKRGTNSEQK